MDSSQTHVSSVFTVPIYFILYILVFTGSCEEYVTSETVQDGDVLILCTDGLWLLVEEDELRSIVEQYNPEESAKRLVERANENGGPDNITAVVVRVSVTV